MDEIITVNSESKASTIYILKDIKQQLNERKLYTDEPAYNVIKRLLDATSRKHKLKKKR